MKEIEIAKTTTTKLTINKIKKCKSDWYLINKRMPIGVESLDMMTNVLSETIQNISIAFNKVDKMLSVKKNYDRLSGVMESLKDYIKTLSRIIPFITKK